jgi:hypothetical protein
MENSLVQRLHTNIAIEQMLNWDFNGICAFAS